MQNHQRKSVAKMVAESQGEEITIVARQKGVRQRNYLDKVEAGPKTKRVFKSIEWVAQHISEKHLEKDIDSLTPWQRVQVWANIQEFLRPKYQRIINSDDSEKPKKHTVVIKSTNTNVKTTQLPQAGAVQYIGKNGQPSITKANVIESKNELEATEIMVTEIQTENHHQLVVSEFDEITGDVTHTIATQSNVPHMGYMSFDDDTIQDAEVIEIG